MRGRPQRKILLLLIVLLPAVVFSRPVVSSEEKDPIEAAAILHEMGNSGREFDAGRLHDLGLPGLSAVLDRLLPDTAESDRFDSLTRTALELVTQLGDGDFNVRQTASERLLQLGPIVTPTVLKAAQSDDAEVRWRAKRIMQTWTTAQKGQMAREVSAFGVYLQGVRDRARLAHLARRTHMAFDAGMPSDVRHTLLMRCLMTLAASAEDEHVSVLRPLLKHVDPRVAIFVAKTIGSASGNAFYPTLLLDALDSSDEDVVGEAIKWTPNCHDPARREQVESRLLALLRGPNESLKFQASFPLMHSFRNADAVDYLLGQIEDGPKQRRLRAIAWIGDSRNLGSPATPELLRVMRPLLKSEDTTTRREAAGALAMYAGEEVVESLIPLLNDPNAAISTKLGYQLEHQTDKQMLQRLLEAAVADDPNPAIRRRADMILVRMKTRKQK